MSSVYSTFEDLHANGRGFEERIGPPDECTSALGHVFVGFSWLENSLETHIHKLAKLSGNVGHIITSEMSFRVKISVLSSLILHEPALRKFNVGKEPLEEVWRDFLRMLHSCEELRNKVAHSEWHLPENGKITRGKKTAKPKRGLRIMSEELTSGYILDIYDYILHVDFILDEFFIDVTEFK